MSASLNKVQLIGRIGHDLELKHTQNGKAVCNFNLATTKKNSDKTTWHRVVVWEKLAEMLCKYSGKGRQIYVEGSIDYKEYDDKQGNKKNLTEITGYTAFNIGGNLDNISDERQVNSETLNKIQNEFVEDDIPF